MSAKAFRIALAASAAAVGALATYWALLAARQGDILFNARKLPVVLLSDDFSTYSHAVPGGMVRGYVYHPQGEDAPASEDQDVRRGDHRAEASDAGRSGRRVRPGRAPRDEVSRSDLAGRGQNATVRRVAGNCT